MNRPKLGIIAVLLALPLIVALADWAWTQAPVYKYRSNGAAAQYLYDEPFFEEPSEGMGTGTTYLGYRSASVYLNEAEENYGSGPYRYFWLEFSISVSTASGYGYAQGYGQIPEGFATLDKAGRNLALQVDIATLPDDLLYFYKEKGGNIDVAYPEINLRWLKTSDTWQRWEGHQLRHIGMLLDHLQGTGVQYSAAVTGSITLPYLPGYGSPNSSAWIGSQKSMESVLLRGPIK